MALIKLNRTKTGEVPVSLADGELFIDQLNGLLYWADATGRINKTQLRGEFAAGGVTTMIFRQTNAPTGWTKLASNNDSVLRVVTGAVGQGGSLNFSSFATTISQTGETTLTTEQIPSHNHDLDDPGHQHNYDAYNMAGPRVNSPYYTPANGQFWTDKTTSAKTGITIKPAGGGKPHRHTMPGFDLKYTDVIIASKN